MSGESGFVVGLQPDPTSGRNRMAEASGWKFLGAGDL